MTGELRLQRLSVPLHFPPLVLYLYMVSWYQPMGTRGSTNLQKHLGRRHKNVVSQRDWSLGQGLYPCCKVSSKKAFPGALGSSQMPVCHSPLPSMPITRCSVHDFMTRTPYTLRRNLSIWPPWDYRPMLDLVHSICVPFSDSLVACSVLYSPKLSEVPIMLFPLRALLTVYYICLLFAFLGSPRASWSPGHVLFICLSSIFPTTLGSEGVKKDG